MFPEKRTFGFKGKRRTYVTKENWIKALKGRVPEASLDYCYAIWHENPFHFVITKSRTSKLGDFTYRKQRNIQKITVNHDLNIYQFLITYIHEVAHHRTYAKYGPNHQPHGREWKMDFQHLMRPMLETKDVFPLDILIPLRYHMQNPKASAGADLFLMKELRKYDKKDAGPEVYLCDIKPGTKFSLNAREFQKVETRRTRVLCVEAKTGKRYLISGHAAITIIR